MSVNGLQQQYIPPTLDGLTVIDADEVYIDGEKIDLTKYVPYTGATQLLDMGAFAVRSANVPSTGNDLINYTTLVAAITNQDTTNATTYLNKITGSSQTVAGDVTFQSTINSVNGYYTNVSGYFFGRPNVNYNSWSINRIANGSVIRDLLFNDDTAGQATLLLSSTGQTMYTGLICDWATASRVPVFNASKQLVSSTVTNTELGYLSGVTSAIQTQINSINTILAGVPTLSANQTFTGVNTFSNATPLRLSGLTPSRVLVLDGSGNVSASSVTSTTLTYLDIGSSLTTLLAGKADLAGANTFTGSFNQFRDGTQTTTGILSLQNNSNANADVGFELQASNVSGSTRRLGRISFLRNASGTSDYSGYMGFDVSTDGALYRRMLTLHPTNGVTVGTSLNSLPNTTMDYAKVLEVNQTALTSFTAASFLTTGLPAGVQGGTISGTYRLTANSGQASMAMRLSGFSPVAWGCYTYTFGGLQGSVGLSLQVQQNTAGSVISLNPVTANVTTTAQTVSGSFIVSNVGGVVFFNFQAASANPFVNWTTFSLVRGDVEVTGALLCDDAVTMANTLAVTGTTTMSSTLTVNSDALINSNGNDGGRTVQVRNSNAGSAAYSIMALRNDNANTGCFWFLNSSTRTSDGPANCATLRNDAGALRLLSSGGNGLTINATTGDSSFFANLNVGTDITLSRPTRPTIYPTTTDLALQVRSNGSGVLQLNNDNAGNITMCTGGGRVGIRTSSPQGDLHVQLANATSDYWGKFIVKTTSFWGDGTSVRSETAGTQYTTVFTSMFLEPHICSSSDGWCYIRYGRAGGVSTGRWWETAVRSDGFFQIGVERSAQFVINPNGDITLGAYLNLSSNPQSTQNTYNSTNRRLMLRNTNGNVEIGEISTWRHRNNDVGWTPGYYVSNAFYKASGTSSVTVDLYAQWWANSGFPFRKNINLSIYQGGSYITGTFLSKGFNILNNHETISLSYTFTSSELYIVGWYDIYVYGNAAGITSDINDYVGWTVTVVG